MFPRRVIVRVKRPAGVKGSQAVPGWQVHLGKKSRHPYALSTACSCSARPLKTPLAEAPTLQMGSGHLCSPWTLPSSPLSISKTVSGASERKLL